MPLILVRDGRALDETSDMIDDVNVLRPRILAAKSSTATTSSGHGSPPTIVMDGLEFDEEPGSGAGLCDFTPDVTPFHSRPVSPTLSVRTNVTNTAGVIDDQVQATSSPSLVAHELNEVEDGEPAPMTNEEGKVFRDYANACDRVKMFYAEQHAKQTMEYNLAAREHFHTREKLKMSVWEAMEMLDTLVDDSDPDTSLSQIEHLLQTAEAIRRDGKPDWMQLVGLVHDLGKLLFFLGAKGQWDVVGDTFPVGCAFSQSNIYAETFAANPDSKHPLYSTKCGVYEPGCGLENLIMSWGHDEYMYLVAKKYSRLPREGLAMIRFHSFYPWHRENGYMHLMKPEDDELLAAVRDFNPYDLYSKADEPIRVENVKKYYQGLISKYFDDVVEW